MVAVLEGEDGDAVVAEFEKHRARFYALIGHCVTGCQSVEDYLPNVFGAALGGDTERAVAIFAVARGLEAKLNLISAALTGADQRLRIAGVAFSSGWQPQPTLETRSRTHGPFTTEE